MPTCPAGGVLHSRDSPRWRRQAYTGRSLEAAPHRRREGQASAQDVRGGARGGVSCAQRGPFTSFSLDRSVEAWASRSAISKPAPGQAWALPRSTDARPQPADSVRNLPRFRALALLGYEALQPVVNSVAEASKNLHRSRHSQMRGELTPRGRALSIGLNPSSGHGWRDLLR